MSTLKVDSIVDGGGSGAPTAPNGLTVGTTAIPTSGALSNRNLIINGGMVISQRYGAASQSPAPSGYGIDRWATYKSGAGTFSIQQSTDGPSGFSNSALITVTSNSTPSGGDYYIFQHPIEGYNMSQLDWGASGAKDVTLSFWVKSSVTGTFGGSLRSSTGNYSYVFDYTVNSSSTWEYKSVNISGATVDTWNSTNGSGINLLFSLGQGTTYATSTVGSWTAGNFHSSTTETDFIANASATFQITGVQLEVGKVATPFEHRSYGEELALCQRYYWKLGDRNGTNIPIGIGSYTTGSSGGNRIDVVITLPTTMRTTPSAIVAYGTNYYDFYSTSDDFFSDIDIGDATNTFVNLRRGGDVSGTQGVAGYVLMTTDGASIAFDAEL
jgi:hypothetical protein